MAGSIMNRSARIHCASEEVGEVGSSNTVRKNVARAADSQDLLFMPLHNRTSEPQEDVVKEKANEGRAWHQ